MILVLLASLGVLLLAFFVFGGIFFLIATLFNDHAYFNGVD